MTAIIMQVNVDLSKRCKYEATCINFVAVGANLLHVCSRQVGGHATVTIVCPKGEFIEIHSADVFVWKPNRCEEQCQNTLPTCLFDEDYLHDHPIMECNERRECTVEVGLRQVYQHFEYKHCVHHDNVIRITHFCNRGKWKSVRFKS